MSRAARFTVAGARTARGRSVRFTVGVVRRAAVGVRTARRGLPRLAVGATAVTLAVLAVACRGSLEVQPSDADVVLADHLIEAPDPAEPGPYPVGKLYYGSGTDRNRPEYRDSVTLVTDPVDASPFVDFGDEDARERKKYWGFGTDSFPLNARVWYPAAAVRDGAGGAAVSAGGGGGGTGAAAAGGEAATADGASPAPVAADGPFPLVLIVHGNHDPRDFSDPGYAYLGELLASRGYIFASVDMNFINGGIRRENDGRGWLLLKHLEAWHGFNRAAGNPFEGKVDTTRLALIGHSRGGGGVAHAAAFNRLRHYPDDADVEFDFGYGIRSLVAIAPVDGQYRPAEKLVPLEDVNYLVFHGSHDGDVTSFMGIRQYQRAGFSGERPGFKASVYVYRANHGQWNTGWGAHDVGERTGRIYDLGTLMPGEEQRRFGKVYISAFLEATLRGDRRYLPLFRDHRVAGGWLPQTMYITRFQDHTFRSVAAYEDDIDLTTGGVPGVALRGEGLATWREAGLDLRSANSPAEGSSRESNAVWVGWNRGEVGTGTGTGTGTRAERSTGPGGAAGGSATGSGDADDRPPAYVITLPDSLLPRWGMGREASLAFVLAPTDDVPDPPEEEDEEGTDADGDADADEDRDEPIDLTVEVVDAAGERARVPLGRYGAVRRPLDINIMWRRDRVEDRFATPYELLLQGYSIPLADFVDANPRLDPTRLSEVRFVFDRTPAGTVVIDDVGFSALDPGFRVAASPDGGG